MVIADGAGRAGFCHVWLSHPIWYLGVVRYFGMLGTFTGGALGTA